jgi:hypothetical protein
MQLQEAQEAMKGKHGLFVADAQLVEVLVPAEGVFDGTSGVRICAACVRLEWHSALSGILRRDIAAVQRDRLEVFIIELCVQLIDVLGRVADDALWAGAVEYELIRIVITPRA